LLQKCSEIEIQGENPVENSQFLQNKDSTKDSENSPEKDSSLAPRENLAIVVEAE
jgi:hypothetical protein